ncbi:MAG: hypothetical protein LBU64_01070 [Planctomycetota bacterium]|nr:hypothetical protein [Planctomycetota bacterium]
MKRNLKIIAGQLSDRDIREVIRLKKLGGKRAVELKKKRAKLAETLDKLDQRLAALAGADFSPAPPVRRKSAGKAAKAARAKPAEGEAPAADQPIDSARKGRKPSPGSLASLVRKILDKSEEPLKAREIVERLPKTRVKALGVPALRKRISVLLATQNGYFEQTGRGLYKLKK